MQILKASELFNDKKSIDSIDFEYGNCINIDFSDVNSIDLNAICLLLDMQKVAVLNNKILSLSNICPNVRQMLDVTGLSKTLQNNANNKMVKI